MMLKNYDESVEININPDCSYLPDHPFRMLVIDGSRSSKTNMLLNLIKYLLPDVDKIYIYIYVKDPFEWKYPLIIIGRETVRTKQLKYSKTLIDYSQVIDDVYKVRRL